MTPTKLAALAACKARLGTVEDILNSVEADTAITDQESETIRHAQHLLAEIQNRLEDDIEAGLQG